MAKHIGIAACSSEGAGLCYRTICLEGEELLGKHAHPEVTLHNHPLSEYIRCGREGWAKLMLSSAKKLAAAGADFVICPDNTIHSAYDLLAAKSPIPWLHIAEEVTREAKSRGYRRLGILGTRWLMKGPVYPSRLGPERIEHCVPPAQDMAHVNRIIFDELVRGVFKPASRRYLKGLIGRLKRSGCDAIVLACTEIPLIITQADSPLPILDSTRLLARAALRKAVGR